MKALVTGAAGFVGSTLTDTLLARGESVIGIDSFSDYYDPEIKRSNIATGRKNFHLIESEIQNLDLVEIMQDIDVVFHQAGQPGVRKSWGTDFGIYTRANVDATQALLEAARKAPDLKRFVYASSSSVYGDAESYPTHETDRPQPRSPYGVTKLAGEHLCTLYGASFGVPTFSLRYFTVYGPRQRPDMAFNIFITAMLEGRPIDIFGDGEQIREFTHVSDIVRANLLAAVSDAPAGTVVNLSGGASVSVNEVLDMLADIHGSRVEVNYGPVVPGDVRQTGGSTAHARSILGWAPEVTLRDGLASEYAWAAKRALSPLAGAAGTELVS